MILPFSYWPVVRSCDGAVVSDKKAFRTIPLMKKFILTVFLWIILVILIHMIVFLSLGKPVAQSFGFFGVMIHALGSLFLARLAAKKLLAGKLSSGQPLSLAQARADAMSEAISRGDLDENFVGDFLRKLRDPNGDDPSAIKSIIESLDLLEQRIGSSAFTLARSQVEAHMKQDPKPYCDAISVEKTRPAQVAAASIANFSGDILESGSLCIYRGVLGLEGEAMMQVFQSSLGELVSLGAATKQQAAEQLSAVRASIKTVG